MNGKNKCKILKDIRRQIAENNDIAYVTTDCKFQGECTGTCPKCEAEVRYLEEELAKRKKAGKAIAVAGIAAALVVGTAGCTLDWIGPEQELTGDVLYEATEEPTTQKNGILDMGRTEAAETEPTEEIVLMGDVAIEETQTETLGEPAE